MTTGPLLVGAHGWLLSRKVWGPLEGDWHRFSAAHPTRWRLWCPDLPGFGQRERPQHLRPTLAAYGRWLGEQALARAQGAPLVLMGHSLGASVALHAAQVLQEHAPEQLRGVICIAAGGGIYQPRPFRRLRQGGRLAVRLRPPLPLDLGPFQAEDRAALGLLVNSTCRGAIRQIPKLVADLSVASLWISGSRDQVMQPGYVRHLAGYSQHHRLIRLEGCGHLPMQTHAAELTACLQAWLQERL
ncbi:MAG: alpha/beta hydrolase [Synechococcus sp.]|nr:alpha/beta hydrolase [Synechococcus sp.]